jgi:hypothetical protein
MVWHRLPLFLIFIISDIYFFLSVVEVRYLGKPPIPATKTENDENDENDENSKLEAETSSVPRELNIFFEILIFL